MARIVREPESGAVSNADVPDFDLLEQLVVPSRAPAVTKIMCWPLPPKLSEMLPPGVYVPPSIKPSAVSSEVSIVGSTCMIVAHESEHLRLGQVSAHFANFSQSFTIRLA